MLNKMPQRLLIIPVLFLTLMVENPAWGEWTKVGKNKMGDFYVDFDRIKKHQGYVYFWWISDYLKPAQSGNMSLSSYQQGDCELFRFKGLNWRGYKESMGSGFSTSDNVPHKNWIYPDPGSAYELILKSACNYVKNR